MYRMRSCLLAKLNIEVVTHREQGEVDCCYLHCCSRLGMLAMVRILLVSRWTPQCAQANFEV